MSLYEKMSAERKQKQKEGLYPEWMTTGGYQLFLDRYLYEADGFDDQVRRIAKEMAQYCPSFSINESKTGEKIRATYGDNWEDVFYNAVMMGHLALSTPVLANGGTDRGLPVSCSGGVVSDSIDGFYNSRHENAMLSKNGFGTSSYLGGIRARGSDISTGGKASGSYVVAKGFVQDSREVSQGGVRRGSWAGYLEVDHDDFDEWADDLIKDPKNKNIGWIFTKDFQKKLDAGDGDSVRRYQKVMKGRMITGKGYIWKKDTVNEQNPVMYKDKLMEVKASNLCTEIALFSDKDHTFTCVLSSPNAVHFDEWKNTGLVFVTAVFLDATAESFIQRSRGVPGLEKAVRFTEKSRALGIGLLGLHSYFQKKMVAFDSMDAYWLNTKIFSHIQKESLEASKWMAKTMGEPEWCKGYGVRNTHLMAPAPNMSSATLCGQVSQGVEPWVANVFVQSTPAGEMTRINPIFLSLAQKRDKYDDALVTDIIAHSGSVQHLDWLSPTEKTVFKTAFEINQEQLLRMASNRQRYIDQGQSLNLFFSADASEEYVSKIHEIAIKDKHIKALYYVRTLAGVQAAKDECVACEG